MMNCRQMPTMVFIPTLDNLLISEMVLKQKTHPIAWVRQRFALNLQTKLELWSVLFVKLSQQNIN